MPLCHRRKHLCRCQRLAQMIQTQAHIQGVFCYTQIHEPTETTVYSFCFSCNSFLFDSCLGVWVWVCVCGAFSILLCWALMLPYLFSKFTVITSCEIHFTFGWVLHIIMCCYFVCVRVCVYKYACLFVQNSEHQKKRESEGMNGYEVGTLSSILLEQLWMEQRIFGVEFTFEHNQRNCRTNFTFSIPNWITKWNCGVSQAVPQTDWRQWQS